MTRDEIVAQVLEITGRYDKQSYVESIIDSRINALARTIDNSQDLVEETLAVDGQAQIHNITVADNFLKVAYLRPLPYAVFCTPIIPSRAIMDGKELVNVYYRSGNTLIVRLGLYNRTTQLAYGWYRKVPALDTGSSSNWMTNEYPDLLINVLAARVFTITGDAKSAKELSASVSLDLAELQDSLNTAGQAIIYGEAGV